MTLAITTDRLPAVLLDHLIDHAALFPPAELSMRDALIVDRDARHGPYAALVGAFVCPSSRLPELTAGVSEVLGVAEPEQLPIAVVVDAAGVPRPTDPHVDLRMLELRMPAAGALAALEEAPPGIPAYVEVPLDTVQAELDTLARARVEGHPVGVKVRCGGRRTPSDIELAEVIVGAAARGLPLKATQGLHHAVRRGTEHGFLNLLVACAAALRSGDVLAALTEESATDLLRGAPDADLARRVRSELLVSYGSCSIEEPVADLRELGILR